MNNISKTGFSMKHLLTILIFLVAPTLAVAQTHDIRDLGAVADGMTLNTSAIQKTIDECVSAGGGEVQVPAGKFVIGTLHLNSNVALRLMPSAVLQGSTSPANFVKSTSTSNHSLLPAVLELTILPAKTSPATTTRDCQSP